MKTLEEIFSQPNIMRAQSLPFIGQGAYIYRLGKPWATVVITYGGVTDHVSVHPMKRGREFTQEEIEWLKTLFFKPGELDGTPETSKFNNTVHFWLHHVAKEDANDPHMDT